MRRLTDIIYHRGEVRAPTEQVPPGVCLAVVHPIKGRVEELATVHQKILTHTAPMPEGTQKIILYYGDYIGTGPASADVIDLFVSAPLPGFESIFLLGPHELMLISFIKGEGLFARWLDQRNWGSVLPGRYVHDNAILAWFYEQGGEAILSSYGVDVPAGPRLLPLQLAAMRHDLLRKIPTDHLAFFDNLQLNYELGDYHFMHPHIQARLPHYAPHKPGAVWYGGLPEDDEGDLTASIMVKDKRLPV